MIGPDGGPIRRRSCGVLAAPERCQAAQGRQQQAAGRGNRNRGDRHLANVETVKAGRVPVLAQGDVLQLQIGEGAVHAEARHAVAVQDQSRKSDLVQIAVQGMDLGSLEMPAGRRSTVEGDLGDRDGSAGEAAAKTQDDRSAKPQRVKAGDAVVDQVGRVAAIIGAALPVRASAGARHDFDNLRGIVDGGGLCGPAQAQRGGKPRHERLQINHFLSI